VQAEATDLPVFRAKSAVDGRPGYLPGVVLYMQAETPDLPVFRAKSAVDGCLGYLPGVVVDDSVQCFCHRVVGILGEG
jgi:hypothetical protein